MKRAVFAVFVLGCPLVLGHLAQGPTVVPTSSGSVTMPATTGLGAMAHTIVAAHDGAEHNTRAVRVVPNTEGR
jgi:hypothetical protein